VGSFRQRRIRGGGKNGDGGPLEGFWRGGGGFVSVLRDIARRGRGRGVLRGLKKGVEIHAKRTVRGFRAVLNGACTTAK